VKRVCAWCGRVLAEGPAERTSHGICAACLARQYRDEFGLSVEQVRLEFWDTLRCEADNLAWRVSQMVAA
jgi:hypothetical protein